MVGQKRDQRNDGGLYATSAAELDSSLHSCQKHKEQIEQARAPERPSAPQGQAFAQRPPPIRQHCPRDCQHGSLPRQMLANDPDNQQLLELREKLNSAVSQLTSTKDMVVNHASQQPPSSAPAGCGLSGLASAASVVGQEGMRKVRVQHRTGGEG